MDEQPLGHLSDDELAELQVILSQLERGYFPTARPEQRVPEGDWRTWLIMSGRGWGKTRTGAELTVELAVFNHWHIGVGAGTLDEARDICVEGNGGMLEVLERRGIPYKWNRSLFELLIAGSKVMLYSGEDAQAWRGPNFHFVWCDELAKWNQAAACWDVLNAAVRMGERPRIVVTTTPKPMRLLRRIRHSASTVTTGGSSVANAGNLAPGFVDNLHELYGTDTPFALQEIGGVLLDDEQGLIFDASGFKHWRFVDVEEGRRISLDGRLVNTEDCVRFCSIDLAAKLKTSKDWTVMAAWAVTERADLILLDRRRQKITERQHFNMLAGLHGKWNLQWAALEKSIYATELVRQMTRALPELSIRAVAADLDKVTRAIPASVIAHDGRLWIPEHERWAYSGPDDSYVDELVAFPPPEGEVGHDDQVDVTAYAARELSRAVATFRTPSSELGVHPDVIRRRKYMRRVERERKARRPTGYWK